MDIDFYNLRYPVMLTTLDGIQILDINWNDKSIINYGYINDTESAKVLELFIKKWTTDTGINSEKIEVDINDFIYPNMIALGKFSKNVRYVVFEKPPHTVNIKYSHKNYADSFRIPLPYLYQIFYFKVIEEQIVIVKTKFLFAHVKMTNMSDRFVCGFHLPNIEHATKKVCWGQGTIQLNKSNLSAMAGTFYQLYIDSEFNEDYWNYRSLTDNTMDQLAIINPDYSFGSFMLYVRQKYGDDITLEKILSHFRTSKLSLKGVLSSNENNDF